MEMTKVPVEYSISRLIVNVPSTNTPISVTVRSIRTYWTRVEPYCQQLNLSHAYVEVGYDPDIFNNFLTCENICEAYLFFC